MSSGIKIAKQNKTVNSSDQSDLFIDSDTPLLKIYQIIRGSFTFTYPSSNFVSQFIYHNLGYVPAYLLFMERVPGSNRLLVTSQDTDFSDTLVGGTKDILVTGFATTQAIEFVPSSPSFSSASNGTYGYTLIVFYDELASVDL